MPTFQDIRLNHFLEVILQETESEGTYHQILEEYGGISTIFEVMLIPPAEVETLKFKPSGRTTKSQILKGMAVKLNTACKYIDHMNRTHNGGIMMKESDFTSKLTSDDFATWYYAERMKAGNVLFSPSPTTTSPATPITTNLVDTFMKGVKR
jgi:hypothetical protein